MLFSNDHTIEKGFFISFNIHTYFESSVSVLYFLFVNDLAWFRCLDSRLKLVSSDSNVLHALEFGCCLPYVLRLGRQRFSLGIFLRSGIGQVVGSCTVLCCLWFCPSSFVSGVCSVFSCYIC